MKTVLPDRQRQLLKIVVAEYVATAVPVASEAIVRKYGLSVSPATVRNDLSTLEASGYLVHPHTSAGRVPTDRGYRFFVEHLMDSVELPYPERRQIRGRFELIKLDLERWPQVAAAVTSRAVQGTAVVSLPISRTARLREVELVPIHERGTLLLVVLQDASVRQRVLELDGTPSEEHQRRTARSVSARLRGLGTAEVAARAPGPGRDPFAARVHDQVLDLMRQVDAREHAQLWYDGVANLLRQPEFAQAHKLSCVVEVLQDRQVFQELLPEVLDGGGVRIVIGQENPRRELRECALILTSYGSTGGARGLLAVLGPTRIEYGRAVSALQFVSGVMDRLYAEVAAS